jgi:hypothetical protein
VGEALTHSLGSREALEGEGVVLGTRGLPQHVDAPLHVELHRERMADAALTAGRRRIPHANPSAACGVHPFPLDDEGKALAADAAATLRGATRAIRRQIWLERRVDSGARQLEEMAMRGGGARAIPEQRLKVRGHALRRRDRVEGKRGWSIGKWESVSESSPAGTKSTPAGSCAVAFVPNVASGAAQCEGAETRKEKRATNPPSRC